MTDLFDLGDLPPPRMPPWYPALCLAAWPLSLALTGLAIAIDRLTHRRYR